MTVWPSLTLLLTLTPPRTRTLNLALTLTLTLTLTLALTLTQVHGKIFFLLVRIKIKNMEVAIIRRESPAAG